MIKTTKKEIRQFAKEGWSLFVNGDNGHLEVMRIDDPEGFAGDVLTRRGKEEPDFVPPELKDDFEAKKLAKKYFVLKGFRVMERIGK